MKGGEAGEGEQGRVRERLLFHQYFIVKVERSERESGQSRGRQREEEK